MSPLPSIGSPAQPCIERHPSEPAQPGIERHPFEPFLPAGARILMLGSFPPQPRRWCMEFYYPNFINDMWRIFGLVFFGDKDHFVDVRARRFRLDEIMAFCTAKGIAMYDTATAVRRLKDNASDNFLEVVEPTDLPALLARIPTCRALVTTGGKATQVIMDTFSCPEPPMGSCSIFTLSAPDPVTTGIAAGSADAVPGADGGKPAGAANAVPGADGRPAGAANAVPGEDGRPAGAANAVPGVDGRPAGSADAVPEADGGKPAGTGAAGELRILRLYRLPSSSRAYPLPLARKADAYRRMFLETDLL